MNAAVLLRQKVLDLAIRGKLTKREKGDEPASALLARIVAEKAKRGVKVARTRTSAASDPISDDEMPFELPKGWAWCRLGTVCEVLDHMRRPITRKDRKPGPYPYYGATCIQDYVSDFLFDEPLVLLGEDGAKWGAGEPSAFLIDGKTWVNNHAHVLRTCKGVEREYLCICLVSLNLHDYITGTTVPKLTQERMNGILIPLPPLAEQKRIVDRIDELVEAIDKYSAAMGKIANAANLMEKKVLDLAIRGKLTKREKGDEPAAVLLARIAGEKQKLIAAKKLRKLDAYDPISDDEIPFDELPSGWSWCRFGDVIDYVQPTGYIVRDTNYDDSYSTPVLTAGQSFVLGYTNEKDHHFEASKEYPVIIFDDFTTSTQWVDFEFKVKSSAMKILVPFEGCDICMRYVFMAIRNNPFRPSTHARHWIDKYAKFVLPLPPLAEQHRIVARVDELLAECRKMRVQRGPQ